MIYASHTLLDTWQSTKCKFFKPIRAYFGATMNNNASLKMKTRG